MMRVSTEKKVAAVNDLLRGKISKLEAAGRLDRSPRTIERYVQKFLKQGPKGLVDHRGGDLNHVSQKNR